MFTCAKIQQKVSAACLQKRGLAHGFQSPPGTSIDMKMKKVSKMGDNSKVELAGRTYTSDNFGNLHQSLTPHAIEQLRGFYAKSIYFSGAFRSIDFFSNASKELEAAISRETKNSRSTLSYLHDFLGHGFERKSGLDIGCGPGAFLCEMKRAGFDSAYGIDVSAEAKAASDLLWGVGISKICVASVEDLVRSPDSKKFDFVFLLDVLEHLEDDAGALNSLHCLLRPLGMLVIEVPIFETSSKQSLLRAPYLYPQHHLHLYSREGFVDMAKNQCWEVLFSATTRQEKKAMYVLGSKYGKNSR